LGLKVGKMMFIPFMGGIVFTQKARNVVEDAFIGIMGPVFGTLASLVWFALFFMTNHPVFLVLAYFGFFINMINMAPTVPLDGGWIVPVFSSKLLLLGIPFLLISGKTDDLDSLLFKYHTGHCRVENKTRRRILQSDEARSGCLCRRLSGLIAFLATGYAVSSNLLHSRMNYARSSSSNTHQRR